MQSKLNNPPSRPAALVTSDIQAPQGMVTALRLPELRDAQGRITGVSVQGQEMDSVLLVGLLPLRTFHDSVVSLKMSQPSSAPFLWAAASPAELCLICRCVFVTCSLFAEEHIRLRCLPGTSFESLIYSFTGHCLCKCLSKAIASTVNSCTHG